MQKFKKLICKIAKNPRKLAVHLLHQIAPILPDRFFLKVLFRLKMGYKLNLDNPQTFSEKLQWLKLYNHKPEYTTMVDKAAVKEYVAKIIGEEYIIPTLGVWDRFEDIDFDTLPNQFVMKCTHNSGNVIICKDKHTLNKKNAQKRLSSALKKNYYTRSKEWPYKNIKPRIIAEILITDSNNELNDYKFLCFNGVPKVMFIASERQTGVKFDYYDMNFNHLPFTQGGPNSSTKHNRPSQMETMINIATALSKDIPHVRVDLYCVDNKVYFGELTFFDSSGMATFDPPEWDLKLGEWIELPQ